MKAPLVFLCMLTLSATCLAAGAWKWVDEKGVTHYGDAPPALATKVQPVDTRPYGPGGSGCSSCDCGFVIEHRQRSR